MAVSSLAGLPGVLTQTRIIPRKGTATDAPIAADLPVKVEGPELDTLTSQLQLSAAERDNFLVIIRMQLAVYLV